MLESPAFASTYYAVEKHALRYRRSEYVKHMPAAHGGACCYEPCTSIEQAPKNNRTYRNWKSPYQLEEAIAAGRCIKADTLEEHVMKLYPDERTSTKYLHG